MPKTLLYVCLCVCVCVCLVIVSSSYEHGQLMYCDSLFLLMVTFIYWSLLVKFKLVLVGKDECVLVCVFCIRMWFSDQSIGVNRSFDVYFI